MNKAILSIFSIFIYFSLSAQWAPATGPGGGSVTNFYEIEGTIFTSTGEFGAGAVYRSTDYGTSWEICNKGLPLTTPVKAIYGDSDYLYAGLHLDGIFRSDDLGETWTAANNGISELGRSIISIFESDNVVYAGSFSEGVYVSTDHGDNWTLKSEGLGGAANRVAAFTRLNNNIFIATPLGVYKTENGGDMWLPSSSGIPADKAYSFDIVTKDDLLFVAALNGVYRSEDAGLTWSIVGEELFAHGVYDMYVFDNKIYVGTNGKIYFSIDDGVNWTLVGTGIEPYSYIYAIYANETSLICGVNLRGVFKYFPEDDTWSQSNAGLTNENVVCFMFDGNEMYAGTAFFDFGQIFKTEINGAQWNLSNNGGWDGGYHSLLNAGDYFLAGTDGNFLYRSIDKAENWVNIRYPEFPSSYISAFCENSEVVFASTFGNTIDCYRSTDDGQVWTACNVPGEGNIHTILSTENFVFTGRSDGVFRSDDLGLSWEKTSGGMSEFPFVSKLANNEDYLFALSNDGLYRSHDNGENWEQIYNPPFNQGLISIKTYEDYVFAGAKEMGFLISEDNGETWEASNPDFFQDPSGVFPAVHSIEVKGDSIYAAYQHFSVWVRPLPNITGIATDKLSYANKNVFNLQVSPNPVKEKTIITYDLLEDEQIQISLFDLMGNIQQNILQEFQNKGSYRFTINADDLKAGLYFITVSDGSRISYRKLMVVN